MEGKEEQRCSRGKLWKEGVEAVERSPRKQS